MADMSLRAEEYVWIPGRSLELSFSQMVDYIRIDELNPAYATALAAYRKLYGEPLIGSTRAVFLTGSGHVIKVPYSIEGEEANRIESQHVATASEVPLTPTEALVEADLPDDVVAADDGRTLLIVRAVEVQLVPEGYSGHLPSWVAKLPDGQQVGWLSDGSLVAFDL
ncbi:hypothetical protein MA5S0921_3164 [Mycobacteroides abscessus 5S-0921]|nr:hypothetical protein MA5S0304_2208 [Mycobacteroides abscessus 5S-0304]EIU26551.1 hypothetical protein MA5S0817_1754 [Mycobacteroides abscessus 5S-0817]EIU91527.1 hypothetical protein MA5S0921_3164 [Mycobacteroides abscessus 5S-0921]